MLGRQSVRITYAHKRKRTQKTSKMFSSPLEVLPPDVDDLTSTQMVHRMLKRSRRVALAEQSEDKNIEHIRGHLAKRIKRTQERISSLEPSGVPLDSSPQAGVSFQTPFRSLGPVDRSAVAKMLVPEQSSPVPVSKRLVPRTSSGSLKENNAHPRVLASPFGSRPGSAAPSYKHKGKGSSSRRVPCISLHAKPRTTSQAFKENTRQVSRKTSTVLLEDVNEGPSSQHRKHQPEHHPSTSTAYMHSQIGSDSESDDELLLKDFWTEGLEYTGRAAPQTGKAAEANEPNPGGLWHGLEHAPRRRGLRKR